MVASIETEVALYVVSKNETTLDVNQDANRTIFILIFGKMECILMYVFGVLYRLYNHCLQNKEE